jgi:hypothetical protein
MSTRWNTVASIIVGAMMWFGPLAVIWLDLHGAKAVPRWADNCNGIAATQCTVNIPYTYPAADLVVTPAIDPQ